MKKAPHERGLWWGEENRMIDDLDNRGDEDWSSTHKRLRIELIIVGAVIFSAHYLGLGLQENVGWFQLTDLPAALWVKLGLYAIFAYFLTALIVRSANENRAHSSFLRALRGFIGELEMHAEALKSATPPPVVPDDGVFRSRIDQIMIHYSDGLMGNKEATGRLLRMAQEIHQDAMRVGGQPSEALTLKTNQLIATVGERNRRADVEFDHREARLAAYIDEVMVSLDERMKAFHQGNDDRIVKLTAELASISAAIVRLTEKMRFWQFSLKFERYVLGLFIPVAAALVLAILPLLELVGVHASFK
jgi:hypothetical protein